jgi:hypothetical protein
MIETKTNFDPVEAFLRPKTQTLNSFSTIDTFSPQGLGLGLKLDTTMPYFYDEWPLLKEIKFQNVKCIFCSDGNAFFILSFLHFDVLTNDSVAVLNPNHAHFQLSSSPIFVCITLLYLCMKHPCFISTQTTQFTMFL